MHPEGFISKLLSGQAGNRIVAASIDASTLISPCCTLPWFPGILLDSLLLFPITCYGIFQSFSSKTAARAAEGQSQYLFTLPRLLSAPGLSFGYVPGKAGTAEPVAHFHRLNCNLLQPYFFFFLATFFFATFLAAFFAFFAIRFSPPFGTFINHLYQGTLIVAVVTVHFYL
jgi:hypothetical protein